MTGTDAFPVGRLRLEEVDVGLVLPQILRLRATVGRRVSLAPGLIPWLDPLDARAVHWGVFREAELVAAARLCVHASADGVAEAALFRPFDVGLCETVAVMSHCVVHPSLRDLRLDSVLDTARIERARQLRVDVVLAVARSARRTAGLEALGFRAQAPSAAGARGLVLPLAPAPPANVVRMPVRPRT